MIRALLLTPAFLLIALPAALAQTPVEVQHFGDDALGQRLAIRVERLIDADPLYRGASGGTRYQLQIVTLNPDEGRAFLTVASTALVIRSDSTILPYHLSSMVSFASRDRIATSAQGIFGFLEEQYNQMEELRQRLLQQ